MPRHISVYISDIGLWMSADFAIKSLIASTDFELFIRCGISFIRYGFLVPTRSFWAIIACELFIVTLKKNRKQPLSTGGKDSR